MKDRILEMLLGAVGYLSGEDISRTLGISRTAVWKYINQLRSDGYEISSATNRGYMIKTDNEVYSAGEIKRHLKCTSIGRDILFFNEIDSTNNAAKNNSDLSDGAVFVAANQISGRGRLGRPWVSGADGLWFSVLLKPQISPQSVSLITLIAGLAVSAVIDGSEIKWPNDVLLSGKKVCGILTEMSSEITHINYVVCGIGINLNTAKFPQELTGCATSVFLETGNRFSKTDYLSEILGSFEKYYLSFLENGFDIFTEEYKKKCATLGKTVTVTKNGKSIKATAVDITANGELVIEKDNGLQETVFSGEVSVRGLLGEK